MEDCLHHLCHKSLDNAITPKFDIKDGLGLVDTLEGYLSTSYISIALTWADMSDEATCEGAIHYSFLVVEEGLDTFVLQLADDAGTQIDNLFVDIADILSLDAFADALLHILFEEGEQQRKGLFVRKKFQFVSIFDIHYLVADVVGSLYKIY